MNPYDIVLYSSQEPNIRGYERGTANPSVAIWPEGEETFSKKGRLQIISITPTISSTFRQTVPTASAGWLLVDLPSKFERERDVFLRLKESLLDHETYSGKFVAIHGGRIVDIGENERELAERVYAQFGYVPIYIGKIERTARVIEMPSPEGP